MKAYKAFNKDFKCRDSQYEVNSEFETFYEPNTAKIELCINGLHCCRKMIDVFKYYPRHKDTRVCEVEVIGDEFVENGDKLACREIKIIRELSQDEINQMTDNFKFNSGNNNSGYNNSGYNNSGNSNSGNGNSGNGNSGDRNSGYRNSGDYNSGNFNSGYSNSRDRNSGDNNSGYNNSGNNNSGDYNSGNYNSGYNNSGNYNSGYNNSGNRNSGNFNSGNYNSGMCNSNNSTLRLFNCDSGIDIFSERCHNLHTILHKNASKLIWTFSIEMTTIEKKNNPSHKTVGGFLKTIKAKKPNKDDVKFLKALPNFCSKILFETTGIKI